MSSQNQAIKAVIGVVVVAAGVMAGLYGYDQYGKKQDDAKKDQLSSLRWDCNYRINDMIEFVELAGPDPETSKWLFENQRAKQTKFKFSEASVLALEKAVQMQQVTFKGDPNAHGAVLMGCEIARKIIEES